MKNVLFLFSAEYPYGKGEAFLEVEIPFLSNGFDEVVIFTRGKGEQPTRNFPKNVRLVRFNTAMSSSERLTSIFNLFSSKFRNELKIIRRVYNRKVTSGIVKTMLISLQQAKRIQKLFHAELNNLDADVNVVAYSYWCDDSAIAIAMENEVNSSINAVSRVHGWDLYFEASLIEYIPFRQYLGRNLDKIFAISEKGKNYCRNTWKVESSEKISVSRLGVIEQEMVVSTNEKLLIVSCSNVIPLKRVELIIESLSLIKEIKVKWVHFGDGPLLQTAQIKAQELLLDNITYEFKGSVNNSEVLDWYKDNKPDLFVNVSSTEGIPVSIMEAMSFGVPAIATDVGGNSEIVSMENGVLLPASPTVKEISNAIIAFEKLTNTVKAQKREMAHKTFSTKYNANSNYSAFVDELMNL
jgi:glycosyltransferase involved in cell wall biosynthesis